MLQLACQKLILLVTNERILENTEKQGFYIKKRFEELAEKYPLIGDVRGVGLMIGVELVRDRNTKEPAVKEVEDVVMRCFKKGLAVITAGVSTLRIAPPLIISRELVEKSMDIIEESIREVGTR